MKTSWKIKSLGDMCDIIGGGTPSKSNTSFYQGTIPWATVRDMGYPILDKTEFCISEEAVSNSATNIIPKGNVIIASRVGLGKVCILKNDTAINQDLRAIIPKTKDLSPSFLYWWFCSIATFILSQGKGATVKGVTLPFLKSLTIPLPPLSEQERIVGILDAAFEKIDKLQRNAERNLENAKELFQQVLDEELTPKPGWKKSLLKDVSQGITDGDHLPPPKEAKGIPFITISNITDQQKIDFSSTFFVSQKYYNSLAVIRKAQYGDILYTVTGSYGIPVLIDFNKQFCFQRHIAIIRPNIELIDPLFLSFLLESNEIKKQADSTATGVAQKTVSLTALRKFVLFFPSLNDQKTIAKELMCLKNKTFEIKDKYTNIKSNCAELKQQVLSSAFNGEL